MNDLEFNESTKRNKNYTKCNEQIISLDYITQDLFEIPNGCNLTYCGTDKKEHKLLAYEDGIIPEELRELFCEEFSELLEKMKNSIKDIREKI